jgi:ParB/RepB/Spo0J family partition protein
MKLIRLPIEEITINEDRQRKNLGDDKKQAKVNFEDLMTSIKAVGLLQPIGVSMSNELIYGFRRLNAAKKLGWTHIDVVVDPDRELSDFDKELMELDENIQRFDLSWHERAEAIARVNNLRQKQDPNWTQRKTAESLGIKQSQVSEAEQMTKLFNLFPELKQAKSLNAAKSQAVNKAKTALRKVEVASNPAKYEEVTTKVKIGPAEKLILELPDGFTKHIVTDGPFGIDYDKRPAGTGAHEAYEDSPESYRARTTEMAPHLFRVLGSDGFMVWFLAHDHKDWTAALFESVGFTVDPVPIVWDRSDGRTYSARPDRYFGKGYDIALHCIKGDPQMVVRSRNKGVHGSGNVFRYKPVNVADKEHIVERPIELYQDIISCISIKGEKITDFFGGSGKIAAAAASLGRDHFTTEINKNHHPLIVQNIYNNTPQEG